MSDVTAESREKGADVENVECPNCGATLEPNEMDDGGVSYGPCTSCFSPEDTEKAAADPATSRERGTDVKEK